MKKIIVLFIIVVSHFESGFSQTPKIIWSDEQKLGGDIRWISNIFYTDSNYHMAIEVFKGILTQEIPNYAFIKVNKDGTVLSRVPIDHDAAGNSIFLFDLWTFNDKLYAYYRVRDDKLSIIFRDELDITNFNFKGNPEEVISGSKNSIDLVKPIWETAEKMDLGIFTGEFLPKNYAFLNFPGMPYHAILKRESYFEKDAPSFKYVVIDNNKKVVNEGTFELNSTNKHTQIYDAVIDEWGGLYLLSGVYDNRIPACSILYLAPGNKNVEQIEISNGVRISALKTIPLKDGFLICGYRSVDDKEREIALFAMKYSFIDKNIIVEKNISGFEFNRDDQIFATSDNNSILILAQQFYDPLKPGADSDMNYRAAYNAKVFLLDENINELLTKGIENYSIAAIGTPYTERIYPIISNGKYYIIRNTHPENPGLSAIGKKLKPAIQGKNKIATELIEIKPDKKIKRDFIYLHEDSFATIPGIIKYLGHGKFLLYAFSGNLSKFGFLELTEN